MSETAKGLETPIVYPTIVVPGKGTYTVKFGARVAYHLEKQHGMGPEQFFTRLREWLPKTDADGQIQPGRASLVFVLEVLSACLWQQARLTPEDLADAFDGADIGVIGPIILEAFSKAPRPSQTKLPEPAAPQVSLPN